MAKLTGRQVAEKHARRFSEAIPDMKAAVDNMTENPAEKALAKMDKMRTNWNKSFDDGKIERGFKRVKLDDWKGAYKDKVDTGVTTLNRHVDRNADFYDELLTYQDSYVNKIKAMPDTTLEDSKQRMLANVDAMAKFRRS